MKKIILFASFLYATNIHTLLDSIKNIPDSKIDELIVKETKTDKKIISYSNYPTLKITASATHFSSPVSLIPLDPITSSKLIKEDSSIPFSQNIQKIGFSISMPIFIKEISDNKKRLSHIIKSKEFEKKINLLKREAELIVLISKLNYLYDMKDAINKETTSIKKTIEAISVGVKVGKIAEFKLLRLKDKLNSLKIYLSQIKQEVYSIQSSIFNLTKIKINSKIPIKSKNVNGQIYLIKPILENLKATTYEIAAKKDKLLPTLSLKIDGYRAFAKAFNTDEAVAKNLASIGVYLTWEYNKKIDSTIQKAKIKNLKTSYTLKKSILNLKSEIEKIDKSIKEIKKSLILQKENISLKEELLKSAKVAFELNRMSIDEYLKYEDDLALAKAKYSSLIATLNSLIAQKAMIYGKNFKKVFK